MSAADSGVALQGNRIERPGTRQLTEHYGKPGKDMHHCHLKKGQPTYVAVWLLRDKEIRLVEITYVGTHEKAPY